MAITLIDLMEYADNASAQSAYQSDYFTGIEIFAVGGGGGGSAGGGGGAGGINYTLNHLVNVGQYIITIGSGGSIAGQGENTVFVGYNNSSQQFIAYGGGHGDYHGVGTNGGSGGGRGRDNPGSASDVTYGQGYKGGGCLQSWYGGAGGGGGAGGVGYDGNYDAGTHPGDNTCKGGPGLEFTQFAVYGGSPAGWFGGGGSGSWENGAVRTLGGIGGGGANGPRNYGNAAAGIANTGGGGGSSNANSPAVGGSGILIIKYLSSNITASGGTEYTDGNYKIHVFTSSGTFNISYIDQCGIIAYSENSIKWEGLYALKFLAYQGSSLNRTLTRTLSTSINLSGYAVIVYKIYSSRSGNNIKISFINSNSYSIDNIPTISSQNIWQTVSLDISSISDTNKSSINKIKITILNDDYQNISYIDSIFSIQTINEQSLKVSKAVGYAVIKLSPHLHVSKAVGYAVIKLSPHLHVSKAVGYAVIKQYINEGFGHLNSVAGSNLNSGSSWHNSWRTIAGGPTPSRNLNGNCLVKIAKSPDPVSICQAQWIGLSDTTNRAYLNDDYTVLLLKFDEANGSTTTINSSRYLQSISCNNLSITSAQSKLNPTSGYFNGSSTYISVPDTEFLNFGTNDFTIDFWFYPTNTPSGTYPIIISNKTAGDGYAFKLTWDDPGADRKFNVVWYRSGTWSGFSTLSSTLNFNQWYHVALIRDKNYFYLYIDGVLNTSHNCGYSFTVDLCYGGSCVVGGNNWDGSISHYLGYLSELRISRKIIRWNANFTPPTTPYLYPPWSNNNQSSVSMLVLSEQQNQMIETCESIWTASTDVTCSVSSARHEGFGSACLSIGASFTTGKIAYKTLSSQLDLSLYQKISFFYASNANHTTNIFKVCLCSDQSGNTIIDEFIIPVVTGMSATIEFIPITIDKAANLGSNINSIAIYAISDPGTITIYLDCIISCKAGNSLSLKSAVSKNTGSEPWCIINTIYNNYIFTNHYFGANETVNTYHRELFELESQSDNYLQVSGSNGNVIKYQGGYNTSTDLIDGETYFRCRTGCTALHTNGQDNIVLDKISVLGAGTGLYITGSVNCDISMRDLIHTGCVESNSLYMNTSYNNKINIKNLLYYNPNINIINSDNNIINIKKHNLNLTHSGYNNKIYASQNADPNIKQYNTITNSKLYIQDFESNQSVDFIQTTNDNSVIYTTRLYREDDKNFVTKYDGQVSSQTIIRHTGTGLAWKLYLTNTVNQYIPLKLSILKLAVKANKLVTVSCYFYRDSPLITGALVCERWQLNGIDQDAIAYTSLLNSWEQLQITFTPTQEGVIEIHAYAYGTATYSVYVDDILFTQAS